MVACQHFGIPTHKRTLNCVLSIHSTSEIIAYLYLSRLCSVCNTLVRTNTIFSRLSSFTPFYYLSLFSYSLARLVDHQPRKRSTRSVGCRSTTTACRKPIHAHRNVTDKHKCVTTTNANEYFYSAPTLPALWLFRSFSFVSFFSFHISSRSHFYHRWIIHVTVYFFLRQLSSYYYRCSHFISVLEENQLLLFFIRHNCMFFSHLKFIQN